ncbi:hypothetical protein FJ492_00485 [Mesorhizobium sp. B2-5-4]|uniref:hypothetical protein n=1 Tax=Mesorhizobium sp. B2-5-4 TaxID=2589926 RepID=UPI001128D9E8|nr:hypothetical protein [Mesorhizobium sp. B2-5-4]TPK49608.1 hypothetical protein FJ492_00485 [Mesorhizobium sp. B2-5-4]
MTHTIDLGLPVWDFTYAGLENGYPLKGGGGMLSHGTGLAKATLQTGIGELREIGLLFVDKGRKGNLIRINIDWEPGANVPLAAQKRKQLGAIKEAAKKAKAQDRSEGVSCTTPPGVENHTTPAGAAVPHTGGAVPEDTGAAVPEVSVQQYPKSFSRRAGVIKAGEKELSPPAGNDAPTSPSTSIPVRERQRPVYPLLPGKEDASGEVKNPPAPAAPLSAPEEAALDETLRRAAARQWPNASEPWPDEQRRAVARGIATIWPRTRLDADQAYRFADWFVADWPDDAPGYPGASFIDPALLTRFMATDRSHTVHQVEMPLSPPSMLLRSSATVGNVSQAKQSGINHC